MITLEQYFAKWDPMGFINDLDAPQDEYSLEAKTIIDRYNNEFTNEQVGELTYNVFIEMIESDYNGFKEDAIKRGQEIKEILDYKSN